MMTRSKKETALVQAFAVEAAQLLADRRCEDIRLLDVIGKSQVCDYTLVATGTSEKQMKTLAEEIKDLGDERDMMVFRKAADTGNTWVVIDCVDVVVHLFEPDLRLFYNIEGIWSDATVVDWRREDQQDHHRFSGELGLSQNGEDID